MSVKVIQFVERKQDGRSKNVRITRTPAFTISEESAKAVVDLINSGAREATIADLPHYEGVDDYQEQVIETEKAKHRESALKKVAKLSPEERAALGIELPTEDEKGEEGEGESNEDEELVSEAAEATTD
tara:strand:+ start:491 stop:877 length:387 start_codon:yes stop_codon:yes gene_type:complete